MDNRSFEALGLATPPSAPSSPSSGYPTNGNPGTGTPATIFGDYWFHQIGEELRGVIVAAGLTPSNSDLTQLLAALTAGFGLAKSLTDPGYFTLPGGVIVQHGTATAGGTSGTITFPIAFPTACLWRFTCNTNGSSSTPVSTLVGVTVYDTPNTTTLKWFGNDNTGALTNPGEFSWLAIGY